MSMKKSFITIAALLLTLNANADYFSRQGRAKVKLSLERIDSDGFPHKIKSQLISNTIFEITPNDKTTLTLRSENVILPKLEFKYTENDWGNALGWRMVASLNTENIIALLKAVCDKQCLRKNISVTELIERLPSEQKTYSIKANYFEYNGTRMTDKENMTSRIRFQLTNEEHLNLVIKFPKYWKLYNLY